MEQGHRQKRWPCFCKECLGVVKPEYNQKLADGALIVDELDHNQTASILSGKKDFASFGKLYKFSNFNLTFWFFRDIPHVGETAVYENPFPVVEVEISYRLLILLLSALIWGDESIDMPHI